MIESVVEPIMRDILGPVVVLVVGWKLARRTDRATAAADNARVATQLSRQTVNTGIDDIKRDLRGFRKEFDRYRDEHNQAHELINDKLTHH